MSTRLQGKTEQRKTQEALGCPENVVWFLSCTFSIPVTALLPDTNSLGFPKRGLFLIDPVSMAPTPTLTHRWWEGRMETSLAVLRILTHSSLLGLRSRGVKTRVYTKSYTRTSPAALFTTDKKWKQPMRSSAEKQTDTTQGSHTEGPSSAAKRNAGSQRLRLEKPRKRHTRRTKPGTGATHCVTPFI